MIIVNTSHEIFDNSKIGGELIVSTVTAKNSFLHLLDCKHHKNYQNSSQKFKTIDTERRKLAFIPKHFDKNTFWWLLLNKLVEGNILL